MLSVYIVTSFRLNRLQMGKKAHCNRSLKEHNWCLGFPGIFVVSVTERMLARTLAPVIQMFALFTVGL